MIKDSRNNKYHGSIALSKNEQLFSVSMKEREDYNVAP
jgi:hypothetical protein